MAATRSELIDDLRAAGYDGPVSYTKSRLLELHSQHVGDGAVSTPDDARNEDERVSRARSPGFSGHCLTASGQSRPEDVLAAHLRCRDAGGCERCGCHVVEATLPGPLHAVHACADRYCVRAFRCPRPELLHDDHSHELVSRLFYCEEHGGSR